MTAVLDAVPVDRITERAKDVQIGRVLLTLVASLFFAVGWMFGKASLAVVWVCVAVKVGWQESRKANLSELARSSQ